MSDVFELRGVDPETVGWGHTVSIDERSGAATATVPIRSTAGRGNFGPSLQLVYGSGDEGSVFGDEWQLEGLDAIGYFTRDGLPHYDGRDPLMWAGQELVVAADATGADRTIVRGDFDVACFRTRVEREPTRIERWTQRTTRRVHFRVRHPDGVVSIYGRRTDAREESPDGRVWRWLVEARLHPLGDAMVFDYLSDGNARYPKRIRYAFVAPVSEDATALPASRLELVLDYGDHEGLQASATRSPTPRPEPRHSGRSGFLRHWRYRCRRIFMFHHFPEALGEPVTCVGETVLSYDSHAILDRLEHNAYRLDDGLLTQRALRPLRLFYAQPTVGDHLEQLPTSARQLVSAGARLTDLYGEGIEGVLIETPGGALYARALTDGAFAPREPIATLPSHGLSGSWGDFDGDGNSELFGSSRRFHTMDRHREQWQPSQVLERAPEFGAMTWESIDLTGDGRADLVAFHQSGLVYLPSLGRAGYGEAVHVPLPHDRLALGSRRRLLDVTGDGLADLVEIDNGGIRYWPGLGHGHFGDVVEMPIEGAQPFDFQDQFSRDNLLTVDVTGNGSPDFLYVRQGVVHIWLNRFGHALSYGGVLPLPRVRAADLRVVDILADGRPSLVWHPPSAAGRAPQYLRLQKTQDGAAARQLLRVEDSGFNSMDLSYEWSARQYVRDREAGDPWFERAQHRVVPTRLRVSDHVAPDDQLGGAHHDTTYIFRNPRYDAHARQFVGFLEVERREGTHHPALRTPVTITRTRLFGGDPNAGRDGGPTFYGSGLDPPALESLSWPDRVHAEAVSALQGTPWQVTIFSDEAPSQPLVVETTRPKAVRIAGRSIAIGMRPYEQLRTTVDGATTDTRREHDIVLETDDYGTPRLTASLCYGRQTMAPEATGGDPSGNLLRQRGVRGTAIDLATFAVDTDTDFRVALPAEQRTYDVRFADQEALLRMDSARVSLRAAMTSPGSPGETDLPPPAAGAVARLTSHHQTLYWDETQTVALPLSQAAWPALVHHQRDACFDDGWLRAQLGGRYDASALRSLHHIEQDGIWWRQQPTQNYERPERFSQLAHTLRDDTATTSLRYDADALVVEAVTDALGLQIEATIDYNTLLPHRVEDPNGAVNEVQRDPLGVIVRQTRNGMAETQAGDSVAYGHEAIDRTQSLPTVRQALDNPESSVGNMAMLRVYELDSVPPRVVTLVNEALPNPVDASAAPARAQTTVAYFDGLGRLLQQKQRVEDGGAYERDASGALSLVETGAGERWRSSGHVVYDSQQREVREHHPFHSRTSSFERGDVLWRLGQATTAHYDALGRPLRIDQASGSFARFVYQPWWRQAFDANDTVNEEDNAYRATRASLDRERDDEGFALARTMDQANTPTTLHLDGFGRKIATDELLDGRAVRTESRLNGGGEVVEAWDEREHNALRSTRDLLGRVISLTMTDAGREINLPDAFGRDVFRWTAAGDREQKLYDLADRLLEVWWDAAGTRWLSRQMIYAEGRADARSRNALGRPITIRDEAGEVTFLRYNPFGKPLHTRRNLAVTLDAPQWNLSDTVELTGHDTIVTYDGVGRPVVQHLPDGSRRQQQYLRGGEEGASTVWLAEGRLRQAIVVQRTIDAFGREIEVLLGNGVRNFHTFDPVTQNLSFYGAAGTQAVSLTYDASGRVVRSRDAEQMPGRENVLAGQTVPAHRDHHYDSLGRLRMSTGRYHRALHRDDDPSRLDVEVYRGTRHLNDGAQVTRYRQIFTYDDGGNLRQIDHGPERGYAGPSWLVDKWVSDTSNRQLRANSPSGTPWSRPEDHFDVGGRCIKLANVEALVWDPASRLQLATIISRTTGTNDDERYQYGADGMRVRRIRRRLIDAATDLVETIEVITLDGGELTRTTYSDGRAAKLRWSSYCRSDQDVLLATLHHEVPARPEDLSVKTHFALVDERNSVTHELADDGGLISYEEYLPYGSTAFIAGDILRDIPRRTLRYTGKNQDDATGFYYFEHRYYSPYIGNWLSPDPAGPVDGLNLFQYVGGDPINRIDPSGMFFEELTRGAEAFMNGETVSGSLSTPFGTISGEANLATGASVTAESNGATTSVEVNREGATMTLESEPGTVRAHATTESIETSVRSDIASGEAGLDRERARLAVQTPVGQARVEASRDRGLQASAATSDGTAGASVDIPEPRQELQRISETGGPLEARAADLALDGLDLLEDAPVLLEEAGRDFMEGFTGSGGANPEGTAAPQHGEEPSVARMAGDYLSESPTLQFVIGLGVGGFAGAIPFGFIPTAIIEFSGASDEMPPYFMMGFGLGEAAMGVAEVGVAAAGGTGGVVTTFSGFLLSATLVGGPPGEVAVASGGVVVSASAVLAADGIGDAFVGLAILERAANRADGVPPPPRPRQPRASGSRGNGSGGSGSGGSTPGGSGRGGNGGGNGSSSAGGSGSGGSGSGGGGRGGRGGNPPGDPPPRPPGPRSPRRLPSRVEGDVQPSDLHVTVVREANPRVHLEAGKHWDPPAGARGYGYVGAVDRGTGHTAVLETAPTRYVRDLNGRLGPNDQLHPSAGSHLDAARRATGNPNLSHDIAGNDPDIVGYTALVNGEFLDVYTNSRMLHGAQDFERGEDAVSDILAAVEATFPRTDFPNITTIRRVRGLPPGGSR